MVISLDTSKTPRILTMKALFSCVALVVSDIRGDPGCSAVGPAMQEVEQVPYITVLYSTSRYSIVRYSTVQNIVETVGRRHVRRAVVGSG